MKNLNTIKIHKKLEKIFTYKFLNQEYTIKQKSALLIGKENGCSEKAVYTFLNLHQIPIRPASRIEINRKNDKIANVIYNEYVFNGKSLLDIEKITHKSRCAITRYLIRQGIQIRPGFTYVGKNNKNFKSGFLKCDGYILIQNMHRLTDMINPNTETYYTEQDKQLGLQMIPKSGLLSQHRLHLAIKEKRPLTKDEICHHLNGNRQDNRYDNLELRSKHNHETKTIEKNYQLEISKRDQLLIEQELEINILKEKIKSYEQEKIYAV